MERVRGTKEEQYWDKVPEKVRRQTVDKAAKVQLACGAESSESTSNTRTQRKRTEKTDTRVLKINANWPRDAHLNCKSYANTKRCDIVHVRKNKKTSILAYRDMCIAAAIIAFGTSFRFQVTVVVP